MQLSEYKSLSEKIEKSVVEFNSLNALDNLTEESLDRMEALVLTVEDLRSKLVDVNVPGFPVPRVRAMVASGETETLLMFESDEEYDTPDFSDYESRLRVEAKTRIADRVTFQTEEDDDLKIPTKAEVDVKAKDLSKSDLGGYLKDLKDLLDDPDEGIEDGDRKKLETIYKVVSNSLSSETATKDIEEFYNKSHSKSTGRFISSSSPGSRVVGIGKKNDPLNQQAKTSKEADKKFNQAKTSAKRWTGVAVLAAAAPFVVIASPILTNALVGVAAGSLVNAGVRATQAKRHKRQRDALKREGR